MHVHIHIYACMNIYIHICIYVFIYINEYIEVCARLYIYIYAHVNVHIQLHTYLHVYMWGIHVNIYIDIYSYMRVLYCWAKGGENSKTSISSRLPGTRGMSSVSPPGIGLSELRWSSWVGFCVFRAFKDRCFPGDIAKFSLIQGCEDGTIQATRLPSKTKARSCRSVELSPYRL